jgi:excisionase family DNA binding protein
MRPYTSGKLAYAIAELPELVSVGRSHIYEEIRAGRLRTVKAGRRTLVLAEDLRAWLLSLDHPADKARQSRASTPSQS